MDKSQIAILSTVANFELYQKTAPLFPQEVQKYVFDGRNGMHGIHSIKYMMEKLSGKGIEWLVMIDEDVIFKNADVVFSIIEKMVRENYTVAGVRDGGEIVHRTQNPYAINTFFSIINFGEIEKKWNLKEVLQNQYIMPNEFGDDLSKLPYEYNINSVYEPYYCLFFWLRRKENKFLFLEAQMQSDEITNSVLYEGQEFMYHTWYARSYGVNEKHTRRIDNFLDSASDFLKYQNRQITQPVIYKKATFALQQIILKNYRKIITKIFK